MEAHDTIAEVKAGIIPTQMSIVSKTVIKIRAMLIADYKKYASPERDLSHYCHILFAVLHENQNSLRRYMEANHIADKSDIEFREYSKEVKGIIFHEWDAILDKEYKSDYFTVPREKLFEDNTAYCLHKTDEMLDDMLSKIRTVAIEAQNKIKELEKEKEKLFNIN
jgi:hypothetical protein